MAASWSLDKWREEYGDRGFCFGKCYPNAIRADFLRIEMLMHFGVFIEIDNEEDGGQVGRCDTIGAENEENGCSTGRVVTS